MVEIGTIFAAPSFIDFYLHIEKCQGANHWQVIPFESVKISVSSNSALIIFCGHCTTEYVQRKKKSNGYALKMKMMEIRSVIQ